MQPPTRTGTPHNLPLDSVRGIAALCVVAYHIATSLTFRTAFDLDAVELTIVRNGWIMVDLFFVLSGIVMTMTYVRPGAPFSVKDFAVRRIARLYPLHVAVLLAWIPIRAVRLLAGAAGLATDTAFTHDVNTPYAFAMQLFLLNAFGTLHEMSWNGPSWSISAECFAYAIFAAAVALSSGPAAVGRVFAAVAALALVTALFVLREDGLDFNLRFGVVRCLYGFGFGVVAMRAAAALRGRSIVASGTVQTGLALIALAVVVAVGAHPWIGFVAPPVFALLLGALVMSPGTIVGRALATGPLVWLGRRSYSIYMVHALVIILAEYACRGAGLARVHALDAAAHGALAWGSALLIVAAVLAASDVTVRYVEVPGSRALRRLLGGSERPAPPARLEWRDGR